MFRRAVVAAAFAAVAAGSVACGTGTAAAAPPAPSTTAAPPSWAVAASSAAWSKVPGGLAYASCVHAVPPGGVVGTDGNIVVNGVLHVVPPCRYHGVVAHPTAGELVPRGAATPTAGHVPSTNGWLMDTWWNSPSWLRRVYSNMSTPAAPSQSAQQTNFFFSSFENSAGTSIIQPVLQWGSSAAGGGAYYAIASWYLPGDGRAFYSPLQRVRSGDNVYGQMEGNTCTAGGANCHWTIIATDTSTGAAGTRLDVTAGPVYTSVQGGVFESYSAAGCVQFPANHHEAWRSIQVWGPTFNKLTPSFRVYQPDAECSMKGTATATSADITWTS